MVLAFFSSKIQINKFALLLHEWVPEFLYPNSQNEGALSEYKHMQCFKRFLGCLWSFHSTHGRRSRLLKSPLPRIDLVSLWTETYFTHGVKNFNTTQSMVIYGNQFHYSEALTIPCWQWTRTELPVSFLNTLDPSHQAPVSTGAVPVVRGPHGIS